MSDIDNLVKTAMKLKEKGLSEKDISTELHLSVDTVTWLLTRGVGETEEAPRPDVKIGWRSIGVFGHRIHLVSEIIADIVLEETNDRELNPASVVGIAHNGTPLGTTLASVLDLEFSIYRPSDNRQEEGTLSSNFASIRDKEVIVVDDVLSSGDTIRAAIRDIRENKGKPVLACVLVNKTMNDDVQGVPLRALIRAVTIK